MAFVKPPAIKERMSIFSPFVLWTVKWVLIFAAIAFWGAFFGAAGLILTAARQVAGL